MDSQTELDIKLAVQVAPWVVLDADGETLQDTACNVNRLEWSIRR